MPFLKANNSYNASLGADYTVGDGTLSVNTIPTNFPTLITVARGTPSETRFTVTGGGSGLLTGVVRFDGANVNISAGVSVECMNDAEYVNQLESAVFTQANLKNLLYAADGGSTDTYAITLPVAPASYTEILGLPIIFKANTVNTGAATLNVNALGAKTIKKLGGLDLQDSDILAGQAVLVVYDGTNFQMLGDIPVTTTSFVTLTGTQTMTNKRITKRVSTTVSTATLTPEVANFDMYTITAQAAALNIANHSTSAPTEGQVLIIRVKDDGTARALTFGTEYRASTDLPLPTTTVISKTLYMGFIWNATDNKMDLLALLDNF